MVQIGDVIDFVQFTVIVIGYCTLKLKRKLVKGCFFGREVSHSKHPETTENTKKSIENNLIKVFHFEVPKHVLFEVTFHFTPESASLKCAVKMGLFPALKFPVSV